ncbi:acid phosphatase 1 isoform X2 [Setaria viridis]|uniref:acid phosphatase 1 isoform X2 n=1 Tax=Setaria viridis TaxID=4556 RepID=UPI00149359B2|nr:acid phosphatase 1-like isoform X2 [Setaria viridis]
MALRLPSLLVLLLMVHATRARDMGLEMMTTSAASGAGAGITSSGAPAVASCPSWRLGVETNNIRGWYSIPAECRGYVRDYMFGDLFRQDCAVVVREAAAYAEGLELAGDGEAVWVFDIDDTALSNLPYYADTGFGAQPYNATYFEEYVAKATAPALPEVLELYEKLLALGIKVAFITGRHEYEREPTVKNLRSAGYHTWEKLVLKPSSLGSSVVPYKSGERQKLVDAGYRIVGNIGDQWSDLVGAPEGDRTFKVPDPMYYVG